MTLFRLKNQKEISSETKDVPIRCGETPEPVKKIRGNIFFHFLRMSKNLAQVGRVVGMKIDWGESEEEKTCKMNNTFFNPFIKSFGSGQVRPRRRRRHFSLTCLR